MKYLFYVYDSNDEATMKVVKRHTEFLEHGNEVEAVVKWLFGATEGLSETAYIEVYKREKVIIK